MSSVKECLQDGDELFVELTSFDIWLKLDISFKLKSASEEIEEIKSEIEIKANRNWNNKHLVKVIQKILLKMLNSYINESSLHKISTEKIYMIEHLSCRHFMKAHNRNNSDKDEESHDVSNQ